MRSRNWVVPGCGIRFDDSLRSVGSHKQRFNRIQSHGVLICLFCESLPIPFPSWWLRAVIDSHRMESQHTGFDTAARKEDSFVIENHFVIVNVPMVVG